MSNKDSEISVSDLQDFVNNFSKYKEHQDTFIITTILLLITIFIINNNIASNDFDNDKVEKLLTIFSLTLFLLILLFVIYRLYHKTIYPTLLCIESNDKSIVIQNDIQIDAENKIKSVFSFLYYYVLTYIGVIIWSGFFYITIFLIFYLLYMHSVNDSRVDLTQKTWLGDFNWIWKIYIYVSVPLTILLTVWTLCFTIPLSFIKPGTTYDWIDKFKSFVDRSKQIIYYILLGCIASWHISIECIGNALTNNTKFLNIMNKISHTDIFKMLDLTKYFREHLVIFITGFVIAFIYGILMMPSGIIISECSSQETRLFKEKFLLGYFIVMTTVIFLYLFFILQNWFDFISMA